MIIGKKMVWWSYSLDVWWLEIWSDESSFTLFQTSCWVCVWRVPKEAWNPECLVPPVKHRGRSVVIWAVISWYCAGPIITLNGQIAASDYMDILGNQVHAIVQMMFPDNDAVFQDDNLPTHTARIVNSWIEEHESSCVKRILYCNISFYHYVLICLFSRNVLSLTSVVKRCLS
jgi:hypothetical protein